MAAALGSLDLQAIKAIATVISKMACVQKKTPQVYGMHLKPPKVEMPFNASHPRRRNLRKNVREAWGIYGRVERIQPLLLCDVTPVTNHQRRGLKCGCQTPNHPACQTHCSQNPRRG